MHAVPGALGQRTANFVARVKLCKQPRHTVTFTRQKGLEGSAVTTFATASITSGFAGEVSDVDLTRPVADDIIAAIEAGMDRYAVLVFRDQALTDDTQRDFTRRFGPLEAASGGHVTATADRRLPLDMQDASNLDQHQRVLARDDRRRFFNLGNRLWHSDSSYRPVTARYSLLSGRIVVTHGGRTEFSDMRAAYDALDPETKAEVQHLVCEHSLMFSRATLGFTALSDVERTMFAPVRHGLVRTHPVTGRESLFLSAHAGRSSAGRYPRPAPSCAT